MIATIHSFIGQVLGVIFTDKRMMEERWEGALLGQLLGSYGRALEKTKFLLEVELNMPPSTCNHRFTEALQKDRNARPSDCSGQSNTQQVVEDLHDNLKAYYSVSRQRFIDNVCRQVIEYFFLGRKAR